MRWMVLGLAMVATPAMAADQFDLVCMFGKTEVRYRVDLLRGEACEGECQRTWKMGTASEGELRLIDTLVNYPEQYPRETMTVDRRTGALTHWIGAGSASNVEHARCDPASFSGFPKARF